MEIWDVIIVGGGPAGAATALQLAARSPALAARTLLLDRAVFPRHKLCGGGIVQRADALLESLGVRIDVPAVPIHAIRFEHAGGVAIERGNAMFRVVRREEFDHALLRAARARGVEVREAETVTDLRREPDTVRVVTTRGDYRAGVVVGSDGSRSLVRRRLVGRSAGQRFVALDVLTREDPGSTPEFREHMAVFDFRRVGDGLRGYAWDFPSVKGGAAVMNRGIGGVTWPANQSLAEALSRRLESGGIRISQGDLEGTAVPLYHPATVQSAERVVLAGDAVGVDPLMGEGISVAIGTGMLAAHAVADAFESDDYGFTDFTQRIARSPIGWSLRHNWLTAGVFYRRLSLGTPLPFSVGGLG
jgi:geranylgeranyl reductase family protein